MVDFRDDFLPAGVRSYHCLANVREGHAGDLTGLRLGVNSLFPAALKGTPVAIF